MRIVIAHDSTKPGMLTLIESTSMQLPNSGLVRIEAPYDWDGNSTPPMPLMRYMVPKFFFLIASLFHDKLCEDAVTKEDRKKADKDYKWILVYLYKQGLSSTVGFLGVRAGAWWARLKGRLK